MPVLKIAFRRNFENDSFGARRAHLEDAIRNADGAVDGRTDEDREAEVSEYLTLHTRAIRRGTPSGFVWAILSRVVKDTQVVLFAVRAFEADMRVDPTDPVGVIRGIAETYGIDADWPTLGRTKFVERAMIPIEGGKLLREVSEALIKENAKRKFLLISGFRGLGSNKIELHWTFYMNVDLYEDALRRSVAN